MNCPKCRKEMETGTVSFLTMRGPSKIMCNFVSDSEKGKGLFKRKTHTKLISSFNEPEAYYCAECDLIVPLISDLSIS